MLAEELIVDNIPPLQSKDTGETALRWMDEFKVMHLSVVDGRGFLGTISESDVLGMTDLDEPVGNYMELLNPACVTQRQHIFEVVKVVNDQKLTIIPVLDAQDQYIGSITIAQLMEIIADMPVANNPGGVIVIEMNVHDYSLSQITRIIEENNTKILGTFVTSHPDSTKIELTIKLNKMEIAPIVASLERHGFNITFFEELSDANIDLRDRFDSFMNYLNI